MTVKVARKQTARVLPEQQLTYLYRKFNWNDISPAQTSQGEASGQGNYLGVLPANCCPQYCVVRINTSFDADIIIGTSAATSAVASTFDLVRGTTGTMQIDRYYGTHNTADTSLYIRFSSTSATPTIGQAEIWLPFLPAQ